MKCLFCKISSMKYYKGVCDNDTPQFGGSYVDKNGYGHEEFNFYPVNFKTEKEENMECVGFVEPKSKGNTTNTFHIENIEGCSNMKKEPCVDDVLVIWCAKRDRGDITVVGWYKHATVWRTLQDWILTFPDGSEEERNYNIRAKLENCTLLPSGERNRAKWKAPSANYTKAYGFGQSMVWYPTEPEAKPFLSRLIDNIENYDGENWINEYPE